MRRIVRPVFSSMSPFLTLLVRLAAWRELAGAQTVSGIRGTCALNMPGLCSISDPVCEHDGKGRAAEPSGLPCVHVGSGTRL